VAPAPLVVLPSRPTLVAGASAGRGTSASQGRASRTAVGANLLFGGRVGVLRMDRLLQWAWGPALSWPLGSRARVSCHRDVELSACWTTTPSRGVWRCWQSLFSFGVAGSGSDLRSTAAAARFWEACLATRSMNIVVDATT
jgi:hypothetical protein